MSLTIGELVGFVSLDDSEFDKGLGRSEGRFSGFAKKLAVGAAAAGVAAAVALAGGVLKAMDISAAQGKLTGQLGLTAQQSKTYGKIAGDLYKGAYGDSIEGVNDALASVSRNIGRFATGTAAQLKATTATALDFATTFDQDVGGATRAVGQMLRTGLAKNAKEAFDVLTRGMQTGADKAEDLLDTFNEYPTQFRKLGISGADAMGLISQGLKAGARDSDIVADALKEFGIRAVDGSKLTADSFRAIGLDADKMTAQIAKGGPAARAGLQVVLEHLRGIKDPAKQAQAAVGLFGTQAEDMGRALFALDLTKAGQELGKVGGAADRMGKSLNDNAKTNIESFKRQVTSAFVDFVGGKALPAVDKISASLAANFGPALQTVGHVLEGIGRVIVAFTGWLQDNQTAVMVVAGVIAALYVPALIAAGVQAMISGSRQAGAWVASTAKALVALPIQTIGMARVAAGWLVTGAQASLSAIKQVAAWVLVGLRSGVSLAVQAVAFAGVVAGWLLMGVQSMLSAARVAAAWLIALGPVGWVTAVVIAIAALIILKWTAIKTWTLKIWSAIVGAVVGAWSAVVGAARSGASRVLSSVAGLAMLPVRAAVWFLGMVTAAKGKLGDLVGWVKGLPGRILGALGDVGRMLWDAGARIIQGLIDGIKSKIAAIGSAISSVAGSIRSHLPFSPAKVGPLSGSGSPEIAGAKIAAMLAAGMTGGVSAVTTAASRMAGAVSFGGPGGLTPAGAGAGGVQLGGIQVFIGDQEITSMIRVQVRDQSRRVVTAARAGTGRARVR